MIHFLRLPSHFAEDMDSAALPAILAYKRGVLISNLVAFVDELAPGELLNIPAVETVLSRYHIPISPLHHP
jgi:hypothetical protein